MKKRLRMVYWKYEVNRGYKGHYHMNYYVKDVKDIGTGSILASVHIFKSKIFKGMGFKEGDIIEGTFEVLSDGNKVRLLRPTNIEKVGRLEDE